MSPLSVCATFPVAAQYVSSFHSQALFNLVKQSDSVAQAAQLYSAQVPAAAPNWLPVVCVPGVVVPVVEVFVTGVVLLLFHLEESQLQLQLF